MTKKAMIETHINEMVEFGETYLGVIIGSDAIEELVVKRCKFFKALNKEVEKRFGKVVCWDGETGMAWIA